MDHPSALPDQPVSGHVAGADRHRYAVQLARYTSWRVGGPAKHLYFPGSLRALQAFLATLPVQEPLLWLGLGSNLLVRDGGFPGTVIGTQKGLQALCVLPGDVIRAQAGVTCAKLAKFCLRRGCRSGLFFAGIPGTVGGALAMNAGACGAQTWSYVTRVETIDRYGHVYQRAPDAYTVGYRQVIKPAYATEDEGFVAAHFYFGPHQQSENLYAAHKQALQALLQQRKATQPIGTLNCGSVFRNPSAHYAAQLIEQSGLKGVAMGAARVSDKHANFILNQGGATAAQIEALMAHVTRRVKAQQGIVLVPEVHRVGLAH